MSVLCFIDTETTGLDPRIHQPYEVCWWREDEDEPETLQLPHSLEYADASSPSRDRNSPPPVIPGNGPHIAGTVTITPTP